MKLGFHVSIAGGLYKAIERGRKLTTGTIQMFATNPRGWKISPLSDEDVAKFKATRDAEGEMRLDPITIHMPYLPNLATESDELFEKSCDSLEANLLKAERLGIEYLVVHMGSYGPAGPEAGLRRMAEGINKVLKGKRGEAMLLLENTAGMGKAHPYNFKDMGDLIGSIRQMKRMGICVDTCHAFAAGYDVTTKKGLETALEEIEEHVGLDRLRLLHLNDSKKPLGSRLDRHDHIGQGHIGEKGFRLIVNHPQLREIPGIMETPRDKDEDDLANLKAMQRCFK